MAKACLAGRLKDLEGQTDNPNSLTLAQQMLKRLEDLDGDFRTHHLALIDLVEDEDTLEAEQVILDTHDDDLAAVFVRVKGLIAAHTLPTVDRESYSVGA